MITLAKSGDTILFTFDENQHYLQNGTIEVPLNTLMLVTDESEMFTFKKSATNDIFVSARYSDVGMSKSELETFYKTNMVGGGGLPTDEIQEMIDDSIDALNLDDKEQVVAEALFELRNDKADASALTAYFDDAEYVSSSHTIYFYNNGVVKDSIDASDFVIDGMIDDVRIETISGTSYLVIDFNTASGKEDIQIPLTDIFDASNYYTKAETDAAISAATSGKQDTLTAGDNITISGNVISASGGNPTVELTQAEYDALVSAGTVDPNTYYIITDAAPIDLSVYMTSAQTESAITQAISGKADTSAVTAVNDVLTAHTANTTIHVTTAQTASWDAKSNFSGSYNDLTDKPTIPTVPTSNTAFTNDAGYITSDALSGYAQTSAVTELSSRVGEDEEVTARALNGLSESISGKVDSSSVVTAVTSASTDTEIPTAKAVYDAIPSAVTYSAGTNISIDTANTISCTLPFEVIGRNTNYGFLLNSPNSSNIINTQCSFATVLGNNNHAYNRRNSQFISGSHNEVYNEVEFACGTYNLCNQVTNSSFGNSGNTLFSIGNGTSSARHNAFEIRQNGDIYISSGGTDIKLQDHLGSTVEVSSAITSGDTNAVAGGAVYDKIDEVEQVTAAALNNLNDKFGGLKLVQISQSDYNNLQVKDSQTLYIIV